MELNNTSVSKQFITLNIIFIALLSAQFIYFAIGLFLIQTGSVPVQTELDKIFMFIAPVIVLSGIIAAKFIYSKMVSSFDKNLPLDNKIMSYRNSGLVRLALIEGVNIFNISIMIITGNYLYTAYFLILIAFYILFKPSKDNFIVEYQISSDDVIKILN
jgi:hypothetical protein